MRHIHADLAPARSPLIVCMKYKCATTILSTLSKKYHVGSGSNKNQNLCTPERRVSSTPALLNSGTGGDAGVLQCEVQRK